MSEMNNSYAVLSRLLHDRHRAVHHVLFVGLILFFWFLFSVNRIKGMPDLLRLVLYSSTYIAIAYLNIYYLFSEFMLKGRPLMYIGLSLLSFVLSYIIQQVIHATSAEQLKSDLTPSLMLLTDMMINAITYCMFIGIGLSIKFIKMWLKSEIRISSLEQENLKANLHNLKSQVSPH